MDKPSEATLVSRGPRPKTVKLVGAEEGLSIAGYVVELLVNRCTSSLACFTPSGIPIPSNGVPMRYKLG